MPEIGNPPDAEPGTQRGVWSHRNRRNHVRAPLLHLPGHRPRAGARSHAGGAPAHGRRECRPHPHAPRGRRPAAGRRRATACGATRRPGGHRRPLPRRSGLRGARAVTAAQRLLSQPAPDVGDRWHDESMSLVASTPIMVGRDAELRLLDEALERVSAGEAASVLVAGEAGIGKSRWLREFRERAGGGALVLTGWGLDYGSTPAPYAPLPAILRGALAELGADAAAAAGPARDALGLLLPELAARSD